jgi:hypothetical protein
MLYTFLTLSSWFDEYNDCMETLHQRVREAEKQTP